MEVVIGDMGMLQQGIWGLAMKTCCRAFFAVIFAWSLLFLLGEADAAQAPMGYRQRFEGAAVGGAFSLDGAKWTKGELNSVLISSEAREGTRGCSVMTNTLSLNIAPPAVSNVWISFFAKPVVDSSVSDPDVSAHDPTGAFYLKQNGDLRAYTSSGWTTVTQNVPINVWLTFFVHVDYKNRRWDLYCHTGTNRAGRVGSSLTFGPTAPAGNNISKMAFQMGNKAYLDGILVAQGDSSAGVSEYATVVQKDQMHVPYIYVPISIPKHVYSEEDSLLSGKAGDDLKPGMMVSDRLVIFLNNGYNTYELNSNRQWTKVSGRDVNSVTVNVGTVVFRKYIASSGVVPAFFPDKFDPATFPQLDVTVTPNLYGSDATCAGWNHRLWTGSAGKTLGNVRLRSSEGGPLEDNDIVYLIPQGSSKFVKYKLQSGSFYSRGSLANNAQIQPGMQMWIKRGTSGVRTWSPSY